MAKTPTTSDGDPRLNPYMMEFRLEHVTRLGDPGGLLEAVTDQWHLTAAHVASDESRIELGWARFRIFRIWQTGWDRDKLCAITDEEGWDLLDLFERNWMDQLSSIDGLDPCNLLVLEHVLVKKEFRGNGLGPLIGGMAIEGVLSSDITHAVCFPAPFENYPNKTDAQAIESLSRTWSKLGFEHLAEGVWGMELQTTTFSNAFDAVKTDALNELPEVWDDEDEDED